jgi:hypothetical protein
LVLTVFAGFFAKRTMAVTGEAISNRSAAFSGAAFFAISLPKRQRQFFAAWRVSGATSFALTDNWDFNPRPPFA